jgi:hypothetical protein
MNADDKQFEPLFLKLRQHGEVALPPLLAEVVKKPTEGTDVLKTTGTIGAGDDKVKIFDLALATRVFDVRLKRSKTYHMTMTSQDLDAFLVLQDKTGEHLAPHWLRQLSISPECFVPLGFSLPNINLQEMMVVASYAISSLPVQGVVMSLVFDDLREDDLRADFLPILNDELRASLAEARIGRDLLRRIDEQMRGTGKAANENAGLEGFVQKRFEDYLTERFSELSSLWAGRPSLRAQLMTDLYLLRNAVLGIKPTSVRKVIPMRYERNMAALEALLVDLRKQRIPVILYVAPIRQDRPTPYESSQYSRWKQEIDNLAKEHHAKLLNLERLVPDTQWGSYHNDDIDFMHFRGEGHKLFANTIAPALRASIGEF